MFRTPSEELWNLYPARRTNVSAGGAENKRDATTILSLHNLSWLLGGSSPEKSPIGHS